MRLCIRIHLESTSSWNMDTVQAELNLRGGGGQVIGPDVNVFGRLDKGSLAYDETGAEYQIGEEKTRGHGNEG